MDRDRLTSVTSLSSQQQSQQQPTNLNLPPNPSIVVTLNSPTSSTSSSATVQSQQPQQLTTVTPNRRLLASNPSTPNVTNSPDVNKCNTASARNSISTTTEPNINLISSPHLTRKGSQPILAMSAHASPLSGGGAGGNSVSSTTSLVPSMKTKLMRINMAEGGGKFVRLNVGGRFFQTTVDTLINQESMFSAMMSGRMDLVTDEEGWILIDRDGTHFEHILNFFRDGTLNMDTLCDKELHSILAEANFYSIGILVHLLQQTIEERASSQVKHFSPKEVKLVPFICTKQLDESSLFETGKAAVKFLCNRQNNKYSYTSQSDENLLKNIELFDKLAVLYQGRLNFFKDIFGFSSNEICQWTFYNKLGQKRAEVCCSSIVYATEKKNIKIEFPEAKVQEELIFLIADEGSAESIPNDVIRAMRCKHGGASSGAMSLN